MESPPLLSPNAEQARQPFVRLDLGCGRAKVPDFIGVDRFPLPGVDIVADLDSPFPFADDSVDLICASHSLEHVRELSRVLREIYRVCKHGAQLCIIAPYSAQGLNHANPYHFHTFNEHTPRFWTASAATTIDPEEYYHPHAGGWGLLESDNSAPDIDLRCIKMEFFYFPEYRDLPEQEKRRRRKHEQDVCDQVVYHLLVLKHPVSDEEFFQMARATEPFESPYVTIRRLQERCERLEAIEREARSYANQLEASYQEARQSNDKLRADLDDVIRYKDKLEAAYQEVTRYKDKVEADYLELSRYKGELEAAYHATVRAKEKLEADYQSVQRRKEQLERDCLHTRSQTETIASEAEHLRAHLAQLQQDRDELERERTTLCETLRWLDIVRAHQDKQLAAIARGTNGRLAQSLRSVRARLVATHPWHGRLFASMRTLLKRWAKGGVSASRSTAQ